MAVFPPTIKSEDIVELSLAPRLLAPEPQGIKGILREFIGQILTSELRVLSFIF